MTDTSELRMGRWLAIALTVLFVLFRAPPLLNAGYINSDGAVVGLQAMQMLKGEWEWLHWARNYLTSIDSVIAVPFFGLFGASPHVLIVVTLGGQLTSAWFAYAIVRRRMGPQIAFVAVLPCVLMTMALNIYLFFSIRQWCLALVLLSVWLIDGSPESPRSRQRLMTGIVVAFVAMFVDLFAVQLLPGVLLFSVLTALDGTLNFRARKPQLLTVAAGVVLGLVVLKVLRLLAHIEANRASLTPVYLARNWPLLTEQCLPWLIGSKIYAVTDSGAVDLVSVPGWFSFVQGLGGAVFLSVLFSGVVFFFLQRIPWRIRALGVLGSSVAFCSLSGFLLSSTAEDIWGGRLLAPVVLTLPFTLAPLAWYLRGARNLALVLSPYLMTSAVGGWLSYGILVDGPLPVRTERGQMSEDQRVGEWLRARGIRYAAADYWVATRLTFVLGEDPIVVAEASEDRYPRWRKEFEQQEKVAYLVHPSVPALSAEHLETRFNEEHKAYEKFTIENYTVFIVKP